MKNQTCTIRTASREEVAIAVDWAAQEGWNPGLHDADCYYSIDPHGFFIGCLGSEPIATISAVKYGGGFGFLGLYIVRPEYRGQGHGMQIWQVALDYLQGCNIGLDGVVARQDDYARSGFRLAFRNARYEVTGGGDAPDAAAIVRLDAVPFEEVNCYDQPFFSGDRTYFLHNWAAQPDSIALGILDQGRLAGYGVMRTCRSGYKIGPLFADTPHQADALLRALKAGTKPAAPVYLDIPEANPAAVQLVHQHGMHKVFETVRMYAGPVPDLPLQRIFGITSFEVG